MYGHMLPPAVLAAIPWRTLPALELGPLTLRPFGVFVGLGVLLGWLIIHRVLTQETGGSGGVAAIDLAALDGVLFRALVWGLVGARLAWVLTHWSAISSPLDVIAVWDGGLQFSGGFLMGIVVTVPWLRRQARRQRLAVVDAAAVGMAAGLAVGRIGCMVVGEHLGGPTEFFLATRYLGGDVVEGPLDVGVAYHNTALYELLHLAVLFGLLWVLRRRGVFTIGDGRSAATFLAWYAVWRGLTDLVRTADAAVLGLTGAQWIGLVVLLPTAVALWRAGRQPNPLLVGQLPLG